MNIVDFLARQPTQVVSFLGTALGILCGFVSLMLGALYNARQNRLRDDRLRTMDASALARSLMAELQVVHQAFVHNAESLENAVSTDYALIPDPLGLCAIWNASTSRLGLLDQATLTALLNGYGSLSSFFYGATMRAGQIKMTGTKSFASIPPNNQKWVGKNMQLVLPEIDKAISALQALLKKCDSHT